LRVKTVRLLSETIGKSGKAALGAALPVFRFAIYRPQPPISDGVFDGISKKPFVRKSVYRQMCKRDLTVFFR
jgi:hypothetical protein